MAVIGGRVVTKRIYICHTYYHVYISYLKELKLRAREKADGAELSGADLVLSKLSNNFEDLKSRVEATGLFDNVIEFDEKRDTYFPELMELKKDRKSFVKNMLQRIRYTKAYAEKEAEFIPVDLKKYKDIYVFCDSDPIGFYLNKNKIYYHAVEDGLNCLKNYDTARYDNRGHFGLKVFFSKKLNLIFIQNGYGKYCIDCEVNDISAIEHPCPYYVEEPRVALVERLTKEDKEIICNAFIRDKAGLEAKVNEAKQKGDCILILTDPLCTLDIREQIFKDVISMFEPEGTIFIKPHPRDELDYAKLFSKYPQFDPTLPMEILGYMPGLHFKKVVGVLTEMKNLVFADEAIRLGPDFMDKYEEPSVHRQNEQIK